MAGLIPALRTRNPEGHSDPGRKAGSKGPLGRGASAALSPRSGALPAIFTGPVRGATVGLACAYYSPQDFTTESQCDTYSLRIVESVHYKMKHTLDMECAAVSVEFSFHGSKRDAKHAYTNPHVPPPPNEEGKTL